MASNPYSSSSTPYGSSRSQSRYDSDSGVLRDEQGRGYSVAPDRASDVDAKVSKNNTGIFINKPYGGKSSSSRSDSSSKDSRVLDKPSDAERSRFGTVERVGLYAELGADGKLVERRDVSSGESFVSVEGSSSTPRFTNVNRDTSRYNFVTRESNSSPTAFGNVVSNVESGESYPVYSASTGRSTKPENVGVSRLSSRDVDRERALSVLRSERERLASRYSNEPYQASFIRSQPLENFIPLGVSAFTLNALDEGNVDAMRRSPELYLQVKDLELASYVEASRLPVGSNRASNVLGSVYSNVPLIGFAYDTGESAVKSVKAGEFVPSSRSERQRALVYDEVVGQGYSDSDAHQ